MESVVSGGFVSEKEKNVEFVIDEIDKETVSESIITKLYSGVVGLFSGPVGNSNMLQLYESRRYGYVPRTLEPRLLED